MKDTDIFFSRVRAISNEDRRIVLEERSMHAFYPVHMLQGFLRLRKKSPPEIRGCDPFRSPYENFLFQLQFQSMY